MKVSLAAANLENGSPSHQNNPCIQECRCIVLPLYTQYSKKGQLWVVGLQAHLCM